MAKPMMEVLSELKGKGNENKHIAGKGAFSGPGFASYVSAAANDKNYKVQKFDKASGKNEDVSLRNYFVSDTKKTILDAGCPQKTEIGVIDDATIATTGVAAAIPHLVNGWLQTGRKFPLPDQDDQTGYIYLQQVKGRNRDVAVRDMKTNQPIGSASITTKDHMSIRAKGSAPKHLVSKVRKDMNGKVISK